MSMISSDIAQIASHKNSMTTKDTMKPVSPQSKKDQLMFDRDRFLKMLLVELETQGINPSNKTEEYVSQIFTLSQAEQQVQANEYLEQLVNNSNNSKANDVVSYLDQNVEYNNAIQDFTGGSVSFKYNLANTAKNVKILILDEKNNIIKTDKVKGDKGLNDYIWSGKDNDGEIVKQGKYRIDIKATNNLGASVQSSSKITSKVVTIHNVQNDPIVELENGDKVSLTKIESVLKSNNH